MSGINCSKCGQWVGKSGFIDIHEDYYNGGLELGYSLCSKCLDAKEPTVQADVQCTCPNDSECYHNFDGVCTYQYTA